MWFFTSLQETLIHLVLALGVLGTLAGFVLSFIPFVNNYKFPIQVLGILALSFGLYLEGGLAKKKEHDLEVAQLKEKISKAEAEAADKNVEIQKEVIEKTKVIKEQGKTQIEYITKIEKGDTVTIVKDMTEEERKKFEAQIEELRKFNQTCTIPTIIIEEHNKAANKK